MLVLLSEAGYHLFFLFYLRELVLSLNHQLVRYFR